MSYEPLIRAVRAELFKLDKETLVDRLALEIIWRVVEDDLRAEHQSAVDAVHDQRQKVHGRIEDLFDATLRRVDEQWPDVALALKTRMTQRNRRLDKPAEDSVKNPPDRNTRIRAFHARLAGEHDAVAQTAREFGLSPRQISRICPTSSKKTR